MRVARLRQNNSAFTILHDTEWEKCEGNGMKINELGKTNRHSYENIVIVLLVIIPISVASISYLYSKISIKHDLSVILRNSKSLKNGKLYLDEVFTWDWEEMCVTVSLETYSKVEKSIHAKVSRFFNPSTNYNYVIFDSGKAYFQIDEVKDKIFIENTVGCYVPKDTIMVNKRGAFLVKIINEKSK